MLRLVPDHVKPKTRLKHAVEKLSFVIIYVLDLYKTRKKCDKAILKRFNSWSLFLINVRPKKCVIKLLIIMFMHYYVHEFVSDCNKTQKMCNEAVNSYPSPIQFVIKCYKTQEMCDKAVDTCFLYMILFSIDARLKKCVIDPLSFILNV